MHRLLRPLLLALTFGCALQALADPAADVKKPAMAIIGSVRQARDLAALNYFADEQQGRFLTGEYWEKGTPAQRKEFTQGFKMLFAKIAFPKVRDNFKNLDTILYEAPQIQGDTAMLNSVVLINHPLKKQELKLKYDVVKDKGSWKVLDVSVLGDSMLKGIRDDQVQPLLKEGGWPALLKAMDAKLKELQGVKVQ